MAFYFALFNVSNANNEIKSNQRDKKLKNQKPTHQSNRRHSVSSTQDLSIDYRLLGKNKLDTPTNHLYGATTPTNRRKSNPESQCNSPNQDNGKKKVTFTPSGRRISSSTDVRRKYSHSEALVQSMYPETESSRAKRAAEWIYSISLESERNDNDLGSMDNGCRSRDLSPLDTVPEVSVAESISQYIDPAPEPRTPISDTRKIDEKIVSTKERIIPIVICPAMNPETAEVTKGVAVSTSRPPSRLPSILRRKSTSDRSLSVTKTSVNRIPYRQLSPADKMKENETLNDTSALRPSRLPRLSQMPRIRCNFNTDEKQDSIPLIQIGKPQDKMIRSHVY